MKTLGVKYLESEGFKLINSTDEINVYRRFHCDLEFEIVYHTRLNKYQISSIALGDIEEITEKLYEWGIGISTEGYRKFKTYNRSKIIKQLIN